MKFKDARIGKVSSMATYNSAFSKKKKLTILQFSNRIDLGRLTKQNIWNSCPWI